MIVEGDQVRRVPGPKPRQPEELAGRGPGRGQRPLRLQPELHQQRDLLGDGPHHIGTDQNRHTAPDRDLQQTRDPLPPPHTPPPPLGIGEGRHIPLAHAVAVPAR